MPDLQRPSLGYYDLLRNNIMLIAQKEGADRLKKREQLKITHLSPTALMKETDLAQLWQIWSDAGAAATTEARRRLKMQGIGVVAKREGVVIEEQPDGTVRPLQANKSN